MPPASDRSSAAADPRLSAGDGLIGAIAADESVQALASALAGGRRAVATGAVGSSTVLVAAALRSLMNRPVVLIVAHPEDASEAADECDALGVPCVHLPAMEAVRGEQSVSMDQLADRVHAVRAMIGGAADRPAAQVGTATAGAGPAPVIVAPIAGLMQRVPTPKRLEEISLVLRPGQALDPAELIAWLAEAGYNRVDAIEEPGEFAVRGGIIDVFPPAAATGPVRLDFFGDELERITEVDLDTMGSDRSVPEAELLSAKPEAQRADEGSVSFLELCPENAVCLLAETLEVIEQGRGYFERAADGRGIDGPPRVMKLAQERFGALAEINQFSAGAADADARIDLPANPLPQFDRDAGEAMGELGELTRQSRVLVPARNPHERERVEELRTIHADRREPGAARRIEASELYVHRGFIWRGTEAFALVPAHELLHRYDRKRRAGRIKAGRAMDTFLDLAPGDYVVHQEHGIARFVGLEVIRPKPLPSAKRAAAHPGMKAKPQPKAGDARGDAGEAEEFLTLEFAQKARLHVPATQIDLVQRYVGGFHGKPPLSTLGGQRWKLQKERVGDSVRDLASEMLRVRAAREHMPGIAYPGDTAWQTEFEAEFPYEETEDQLAALQEIKRDMTGPRPMDRLLCGDVGFGKTELAIRAAFKACEFGKQVAVLVPTTVLAEQHERTFRARFADYPFRVESLSRFKTTKEINQTLAGVRKGAIDVIVGTHRLLSKDVRFSDLGLVVIDEEQRFGVEHKERLLQLRMTVDVLTLSATPIPRTLHMSMLGLRDISSLTTAPLDRRAIVTEVIPYNARRIRQAMERELSREGQIFFVHNRVNDIHQVAADVQSLAPDARVVVGHGQMPAKELEEVMLRFMRKEADILVATTIIESGIDIPTANTMFINDADRFGLAELHQLRGRVGRYKHRAYCYMLLNPDRPMREVAQKRLKAIEEYSMLGAGFKIAMRDLEIRGAGNLLGAEQSGHIAAVGYELYCRLLEGAVHELNQDEPRQELWQTQLDIGVRGIIPRPYIPSDQRRLDAYRRIATAGTPEAIDAVERDLTAAYGEPPRATQRLLKAQRLRAMLAHLGVRACTVRKKDIVMQTAAPDPVEERLRGITGEVAVVGGKLSQTNSTDAQGNKLSEVYWRPPEGWLDEPMSLLRVLLKRLDPRDED